jgi:hypothetical protein
MQSKHRKQMTAAEIQYTESLVHGIDTWCFDNDHLLARMEQKGVSKKDAAITLRWGAIIRVQDDGRVLLRLMNGMRKGVCVVVSLKDFTLVTAWYNKPTDQHTTLDMSEYTWKVNVIEYLRSIQ